MILIARVVILGFFQYNRFEDYFLRRNLLLFSVILINTIKIIKSNK